MRQTRRNANSNKKQSRRFGAALVEMAVVTPVFFTFLFGLLEFAHANMVTNTLNAACKKGARYGATEGVTTAQAAAKVQTILASSFNTTSVTVQIKNADVFDTPNVDPKTINYATLPDIELSTTKARKLFVIRATVPYQNVSITPPFWIKNATLKGQAVMRHE